MNIHPIFVHFPIALLTLYAIFEIIQNSKLREQFYFFYVKAVLVITGTISSFLALQTGELAEELRDRSFQDLIELHSTFANISVWIFSILGIIYLILWVEKSGILNNLFSRQINLQKIWNIIIMYAMKINDSLLMKLIALIGLMAITITGGLGGVIVYGPDVDPFASFIYNLFF